MSTIKVVVRVRPLNEVEISQNCAVVVKAENSQVTVTNPESERSKTFTFDNVFSPCDPKDEQTHSAQQRQVCSVIADHVLPAAFEGYNTCIFSYGQSGTGKTFSMLGNDKVQGLIEYLHEDLFKRAASCESETSFRAEISFLEIYNEYVNDLLAMHNQRNVLKRNNSLKVHDDPEKGTYVEKLTKLIVTNIEETRKHIERGFKNRIALQSSDGLSRRSHTVFILHFTQASMVNGVPSEKVSKLSFVDLVGTDRRQAKHNRAIIPDEDNEAAIARSLQTFGQVISSLASKSNQTSENGDVDSTEIPYKESALTSLLKDYLGGNCKTVMLATVSPANIHYNKTISTLRYANHTKNIMNKPSVNEEANVKLIKELRDEIGDLRLTMAQEGISQKSEKKLKENERLVKCLTGIWEEKWMKTKEIMKERSLEITALGQGLKFETEEPHFITLGGGRLSVGVTMCPVKQGQTVIGLPTSDSKPDIALNGKGIQREHCFVEYDGNTVMFIPNAELCSIDGVPVTEPTKLPQGCMVCLGKSNYFRFNHPKEAKRIREKNPGNRFSVMPDKCYPEVELAIEQRKREQEERDRLRKENARLLAREKEHDESLKRLEYEKKQLTDESNRLRSLEKLQREEAEKFKTRIAAQIEELEEQRNELKIDQNDGTREKAQYFEDEEEKLDKIQVLQAERVKLLEKDLEEQIVKLHETRDLELAKINAERDRITELAKQQRFALEQVEVEKLRLKEEREKEFKALDIERKKLEELEKERIEIIEKVFQEREQGKHEIETEKQRLVELQNKYNEQLAGLEESMLSTQEKMEKERQLEFEFFETEQLMLEELEVKQREAAEQMERERKLIEAHYECERQEERRKLEVEKVKVEEAKREHNSALRVVEEERKKLQADRQRQQEQMVRDKVRLTNIEKKYKELLSRAEQEKEVLRGQLEKEKEEEIEKFRVEILQTMSSASSIGRQSAGSASSSKKTSSSDDVNSGGKKSPEGPENDELEAEREKLRCQFQQIQEQEERLIAKEREMAEINEQSVSYQQQIQELEKKLEEEKHRREDTEKELQEKEVLKMGNGKPGSSPSGNTIPSIPEAELDLVRHLVSTGHVLDNCPSVNVTQSCCRGYLEKKGGKLKPSWKKRWFVFDRRMKALLYFKDQQKKEPRAIIYFQAIQEVYVDHESEAKANSTRSPFCVKTPLKTYVLSADNALTMSVWIDVLLTGREGSAMLQN